MALTPSNWPSATAVERSLAAQFSLPPLPAALQPWLDWCAALPAEVALHLEAMGPLTGPRTVDGPSLLRAMEGYRFVLDQLASTPEQLVWHDMVECGDWQPHWLVLQNSEGDPLIADLSQPTVPVLEALHGAGHWDPQPCFDSVAELMQQIEVYTPQSPGDGPPTVFYSVDLVDLGPQPLRVLTALKTHPRWRDHAGARLLALRDQLPLCLLDNNVSASLRDHWVHICEAQGGKVEVRERTLPRP
ncbi:MAG: hypothetical protein LBE51_19795 [Acidovorax sp.]|jgi:hypothetical protein|nr:hypothetical protein [Acidovorax sp.]